jgi:HSP20 family protein
MEKRRDLEQAAEEIEQLFADLWQVFPFSRGLRRGFRPQIDCYRTDDAIVVVAELAGVDPDTIQLVAGARGLVLGGERRRPKEGGHYRQMEIDYGAFHRQVTWDDETDPEQATAAFERGILQVTLPLAPERAPQERVEIHVRLGR